MKRISTMFLALCLLSSGSAYAAGISVNNSRGYATTLDIECPKVNVSETSVLGAKALEITAPEASLSSDKDLPTLPRYTAMVMVDPSRRPVFQVNSLESEIITVDARIVPSKGNFTRNINPSDVPYNFGEAYSNDKWYPADEDLVKMGEPFIFREVRGVNLIVNPVQYNPVKNQIKLHKKIRVTVSADEKISKNQMTKLAPISKAFEPIYKNTFVNFKQATSRLPRLDENGRLLIIAHDAFMEAMNPFVDWKKKCGIDVKIVPMSAVGKTNTEVKAFIQEEFNQGNLTNVMLVGDAEQIPTNKGVKENADSDAVYVKLAGDDHVPDAIISRLSANTDKEVAYQVAKFVNYERFPTTNKAWYTRALGIGSAEGNPKDYQYIDEIRTELLGKMFTDIVKAYDPGATAAMVTAATNEGISLINYLGHGSGTSWGTTRFSNTEAGKLSNGWMMPVIWDVACVNGRFVNFTGFGEAWMRSGNIESPAGAVSYAGATTNMEWVPPIHVQAEFNKNLIANEVYKTTGGIFMNGIMKGLELYTAEPKKSGVMMLEQWHLYGDSTLNVRFKAPTTIAAESKAVRNADNVSVTVNVRDAAGKAVSNARVSVYTTGVENVRVATTNDNGEAVVTMPADMTEGFVTVIGADVVPVVDMPVTF
ncbi:MAG TPA: C25 family cysteine peptidase [Candidatus Rifleibacterium sp.]|nr:C25 family cysteine peptidase [Candidatus Rifleibacterium sp.]